MIVGIGVDMVTISRIARAHDRFGERFARRFLGSGEMPRYQNAHDPARVLAKRFAVKEAAVKALGTGERVGVLLKDFTISHNGLGKPELHAAGRAAELCASLGVQHFHVTLTDEGDQVVAFVILES